MKKIHVFFLLLIFIGCGSKNDVDQNYPTASKGVIDFTNWDFEKNGNVLLDGEWEFYWNELLTPEDFEKTNLTPDWIQVPKPWNNHLDENQESLPAHGFATYRLKIITSSKQKKLSIRLIEIRDAYNLWIEGDLVIEHGKVGKSKANTVAQSNSNLTTFEFEDGQTEIIIQVSNFRSSKAGFIRKSMLLGTESNIQRVRSKSIGIVLFLIGCYLIIGISHLYFYQMRRNTKGALYFSILCFLSMIRVMTTGDMFLIYWTNIPTEVSSKLAYLSVYMIVLLFLKYLSVLFPREISGLAIKINTWGCVILSGYILCAPNEFSHYATPVFQGLLLLGSTYLLYALFQVLIKRRKGGLVLTIGMLIVILTSWHDTFYEVKGTSEGFLFPFGILFFMLLQAFFLTRLFARSIDKTRKISDMFRKFVPVQFIKKLGKKTTENIPIGIAKEEELTISFSDIRSFSTVSEEMSSQELLVYLNNFFEKMDAPIRNNYGFIDKYIGDSIMSIFDRKVDQHVYHPNDAIQAGIAMHEVQHNHDLQHDSMFPIKFGIGIHTGNVILGTVGSAFRMDSTVIGNAVNLTSRLEWLTKYFDAQIIISESILKMINPNDYHLRQLDRVVVKGNSNIVSIFEVFDANSIELKEMKIKALPFYKKGLEHYFNSEWEMAIESFHKSLAVYPTDNVSKIHINRCEEYKKKAPPKDWQGEYYYDIK
ncbi:MAG: adenylate/guanylate cyclase domain-containing protein [Saprospiraceae bacterium]